jgi:hypothetical protein
MDTYRSIDSLPNQWLDDVKVEVVPRGSDHAAPQSTGSLVQIYAGTIYQVHNITYLINGKWEIILCLALQLHETTLDES